MTTDHGNVANGPLSRMFVTDDGQVWAQPEDEIGWLWLREHFYESGWRWESGYDEPLRPVTPLLDLVAGVGTSAAIACAVDAALARVKRAVQAEIDTRADVAEYTP